MIPYDNILAKNYTLAYQTKLTLYWKAPDSVLQGT